MRLSKAVLLPLLALALGPVLLLFACDSATLVRPRIDSTYYIAGTLVKEPNRNVSVAAIELLRNDETADDMSVIVGNDTLAFDTLNYPFDVYSRNLGPADSLLLGNALIVIRDGTIFSDTLGSVVPGNLTITSIVPQLKGPADNVSVSWTGAANTEGYVLAAVKQDSVYEGVGWAQFVQGGFTSGTINDSAFTRTTFQGAEPDPGIYYIYVYSFSGSPDSALSAQWLPVPFPAQLADNIDETDFSGHVGTVVVSYFGTVEVLAAP